MIDLRERLAPPATYWLRLNDNKTWEWVTTEQLAPGRQVVMLAVEIPIPIVELMRQ